MTGKAEVSSRTDFTDEDRAALRAVVRDFGRREVEPVVRDYDRAEELPMALLERMADLGFFGGIIPARWGGAGLDHVTFAVLIEEMSIHDHVLGMLMGMPSALVGSGILTYGTDAQRERWLRPLAEGKTLGSAAITEPQAGSDAAAMTTRFRRDGGGYVLDGVKTWITNIDVAAFFILFATSEPGAGKGAISAFLVPADAAGIGRSAFHNKRAFRPMNTGELVLDGVRVDADALLGEEGRGWEIAMHAVELGRLAVAAQATGLAIACLDDAVRYATNRDLFGQSLATFQLTEQKLADMAVGIEASRALYERCAAKLDRGERARTESSIAKLFATEAAQRAANDSMLLHGAYSASDEYRIGRLYRDVKILEMGEGPNEVHRGIIARDAVRQRPDF